MTKWEYLIINFVQSSSLPPQDLLNDAGKEGWEAFQIMVSSGGLWISAVLKRPLADYGSTEDGQ